MAQVTPSLIAEFKARLDRGEHINSTCGEERQLIHAWEEWQRVLAAWTRPGDGTLATAVKLARGGEAPPPPFNSRQK